MSRRIAVVHGPNLNLLGTREPDIYGQETLDDIDQRLKATAQQAGAVLDTFQSNHEGALVDHIQGLADYDGIIVNAAALTHSSVALRDALVAIDVPFIEVHLSNVFAREDFRHASLLADRAVGVVSGLKSYSYDAALSFLLR